MTTIKKTKLRKASSNKKTKKTVSIVNKNNNVIGKKKNNLKKKIRNRPRTRTRTGTRNGTRTRTRTRIRNKRYCKGGNKKTVKNIIITSNNKSNLYRQRNKKITKIRKLPANPKMKGGSGRQLNELINRCYEFFDYQDKRDSRRWEFKLNAKKKHLKNKFKQNMKKSRKFIKRLKLYRNDIIRENYPHREDIEEYLTIIDILSMFRNTEAVKDIEAKYKFNDFLMTNEFYLHLKNIYNDANFEFAIKALSDRKIFKQFNDSIDMIEALLKNIERMDVLQFCQIIERYRDYRPNYRGRSGVVSSNVGNYYNYPGFGVSYV